MSQVEIDCMQCFVVHNSDIWHPICSSPSADRVAAYRHQATPSPAVAYTTSNASSNTRTGLSRVCHFCWKRGTGDCGYGIWAYPYSEEEDDAAFCNLWSFTGAGPLRVAALLAFYCFCWPCFCLCYSCSFCFVQFLKAHDSVEWPISTTVQTSCQCSLIL